MLSLFKKFKDGLTKTVSAIAAKTSGLFGGRKIDAASLEELEEALYTADFGVETTTEILNEIKAAHKKDAHCKAARQPRSAQQCCSACSPGPRANSERPVGSGALTRHPAG